MAIQPLQLPVWKDVPQLNFAPLDAAGDAFAAYRQRGALADALPGMLGVQPGATQGGAPLNALGQGQPVQPANGSITPDQTALLTASAQKYGIDPNYLITAAKLEGTTKNPASSAQGLGQFIDGTAKQYGVVRGNDASAADAFARFTVDNKAALTNALGRDPTPGELYLAHQQGAQGAIKLLTQPNAQAASLVGQGAIANNGGSPLQTAGDFADRWRSRFGGTPTTALAFNGNTPPLPSAITQGGSAPPTQSQPAQYQPGQPAQPQGAAPGAPPQSAIPPETMSRLQAMIRAGGPAQQFAMAMLQKYIVPQTPSKVGEGEVLVNPITGQVIARGGVKPATMSAGGAAINPNTGQVIYQVPNKPESVAPGGTVIDPQSGRVVYQAPLKPEAVAAGSTVIDPATGKQIYSAPNKPVSVAPGADLVQPDTGKAVYSSNGGTLTPAAVDLIAERAIKGDHSGLQEAGNGTLGATNRAAILNRMAEKGANAEQLNLAKAEFEGSVSGQRSLGTQEAKVGSAAYEAGNAIELARGAIDKVSRANGFGVFNRPLNQIRQLIDEHKLNPDQTELYVRTQAVINTYSTVMSRNGVPTDSARDHAEHLLDTAGNSATFNRALDTLTQEINLAKTSPEQMREQYRREIGINSQPSPPAQEQRSQLPKGFTGAMVVNDAKQAWSASTPQQRAAMSAKAAKYGIDLGMYGLK